MGTLEINHCADVEIRANCPIATVQCDECTEGAVRILFSELEHIGTFYHQNSPALEVAVDGHDLTKIGNAEHRQFATSPRPEPGAFYTHEVVRGENDYPLHINPGDPAKLATQGESEKVNSSDEQQRARAEAKRADGNNAFKANDFLQAAVYYTEATGLCPDLHLAWANRALCMLQTGQLERALDDATKCTELAPDYAKGWFRKGVALHGLKRYGEAIPALVKAEAVDPKNSQIPEAIKMAQLMCRKHELGGKQ